MSTQSVYTITFGDQAENHVGMQQIGSLAESGFQLADLEKAITKFDKKKVKTQLINLGDGLLSTEIPTGTIPVNDAYLLIIPGGVDIMLKSHKKTHNDLYKEQQGTEYDSKAFMYGRVVSKKARHNVCFGDTAQEPDYPNKKGRIVPWKKVPLTNHIRNKLFDFFGQKAYHLMGEGNYYYDVTKCGIGFHGDAKRRIVIGVRCGDVNLPIHYQWYYRGNPIGNKMIFDINPGDIYVMSQKATGFDWKKKTIMTLRHAVGADSFTTIKITPPVFKVPPTISKMLEKYSVDELDKIFLKMKEKKLKEEKKKIKADSKGVNT